MQEEDEFVEQAEKILRNAASTLAASRDKTKLFPGEQPQETKPAKTEPQVTTEDTARTSSPTPMRANKDSLPSKSSLTTTADESGYRSDLALAAARNGATRQTSPAKVVNEVTGEVLPVEPTVIQMQPRSEVERERERLKGQLMAAVAPPPFTRDVATGMSPATNSGVTMGSQGSGDEGGGRKGEPSPPSLSSQTSTEVSLSLRGIQPTELPWWLS